MREPTEPRRPLLSRYHMHSVRNAGATRAGLAILIVFLNGIIMAAMLWVEIPPTNKDVLLLLVGGLTNATGIACGYFFGADTQRRKDDP